MDIFSFAKREFEKQYDSTMTVMENKPIKEGAITKNKWGVVDGLENIPCRVSKKQLATVGSGEFANATHLTTLHCDPLLDIKAGSRITITDCHKVSRDYKRSSEGFNSYKTHQEIVLLRDVIA